MYVFYALTAFFLSKPIVSMVGPKNGLLLGVIGYCIYIGGFLFAILVPSMAWPVFIIAASIGVRHEKYFVIFFLLLNFLPKGIAGGLLWPSQGRYFARNAKLYSDNTSIPVEKVHCFHSKFCGIGFKCNQLKGEFHLRGYIRHVVPRFGNGNEASCDRHLLGLPIQCLLSHLHDIHRPGGGLLLGDRLVC